MKYSHFQLILVDFLSVEKDLVVMMLGVLELFFSEFVVSYRHCYMDVKVRDFQRD